jgi:hypothetical protein
VAPRGLQYWLDHPEERAAALALCRESAAAEADHNARFRDRWKRRIDFEGEER